MSNWALLQEQLTGLPVHKRAKYGIHFKRPDGLIEASFVGKPCHYLDGAVWRAIDTKLIKLSDGWYGSPHSDVRIHPDGRVKAGGYQQYSELVGAKAGKVDGDRIVREFGFGVQYLYMQEDGFRQETVITRTPTTAEAKYLIATESGELPGKYKRSNITAVDADGDVHEFINLGQFKKWLDKAAYPVVIDPDFSPVTILGDHGMSYGSQTRNNGTSATMTTAGAYVAWLMRFDLSSVSASAECSAGSLKFTKTAASDTTRPRTGYLYKIADANGNWIPGTKNNAVAGSGETCWDAKEADGSSGVTTAWAGSEGCQTAGTDYVDTSLGSFNFDRYDAQYTEYTITINSDGLTVLKDWFGDVTNNGLLIKAAGNSEISAGASENATAAYRPVLTVTYTAAGIAIPVAQYYYNRLRRN